MPDEAGGALAKKAGGAKKNGVCRSFNLSIYRRVKTPGERRSEGLPQESGEEAESEVVTLAWVSVAAVTKRMTESNLSVLSPWKEAGEIEKLATSIRLHPPTTPKEGEESAESENNGFHLQKGKGKGKGEIKRGRRGTAAISNLPDTSILHGQET